MRYTGNRKSQLTLFDIPRADPNVRPDAIVRNVCAMSAVWSKMRFGRIFANTVASVQLYRKKIAEGEGGLDVLKEVDRAVADAQGAKADNAVAPITA